MFWWWIKTIYCCTLLFGNRIFLYALLIATLALYSRMYHVKIVLSPSSKRMKLGNAPLNQSTRYFLLDIAWIDSWRRTIYWVRKIKCMDSARRQCSAGALQRHRAVVRSDRAFYQLAASVHSTHLPPQLLRHEIYAVSWKLVFCLHIKHNFGKRGRDAYWLGGN